MTQEQRYVEERLNEMREQFDFNKDEEKDLIKEIKKEFKEMNSI